VTGETRRGFHQQLDEIQRDIIRLAAHVTEAIPRATETLLTHDLAQAQQMIDDDDLLDALSIDVEERCYQAMALQQPMASDLRALVTAVRLVSEIERSGDLMVNVAKAARRIFDAELDPRLSGMLARMGDEAARLFRLAMDAYAESDAALAAALDDMDDGLDALHQDYIQAVLELYAGAPDVQAAVQLALVGRYYERVGDHAVNIGERVRYMVEGWLPEHTGAARLAARHHSASSRPGEVP
jgi:phosphate transport system protein